MARDRISDPENEVLVSTVSCWEHCTKGSPLKVKALADINEAILQFGTVELASSIAHSLKTETLQSHHRNPFDRMLIA